MYPYKQCSSSENTYLVGRLVTISIVQKRKLTRSFDKYLKFKSKPACKKKSEIKCGIGANDCIALALIC